MCVRFYIVAQEVCSRSSTSINSHNRRPFKWSVNTFRESQMLDEKAENERYRTNSAICSVLRAQCSMLMSVRRPVWPIEDMRTALQLRMAGEQEWNTSAIFGSLVTSSARMCVCVCTTARVSVSSVYFGWIFNTFIVVLPVSLAEWLVVVIGAFIIIFRSFVA